MSQPKDDAKDGPGQGDEPFLSRWSRRKREQPETQVAAKPSAASRQRPDPSDEQAPANTVAETEAAPPLNLSTLPRVEELTAQTDITAFLDSRVPAALRNAALNRMWTLDPAIRDFIEVAENQWNWNIPGGAPGYGPLEPGTDVAKLLEQATGMLPKADPQADERSQIVEAPIMPEHEVAVGSASEPQIALQQVQTTEDSGTVEGEAVEGANTAVSAKRIQFADNENAHAAVHQMPTDQGPNYVRRHGRALPT